MEGRFRCYQSLGPRHRELESTDTNDQKSIQSLECSRRQWSCYRIFSQSSGFLARCVGLCILLFRSCNRFHRHWRHWSRSVWWSVRHCHTKTSDWQCICSSLLARTRFGRIIQGLREHEEAGARADHVRIRNRYGHLWASSTSRDLCLVGSDMDADCWSEHLSI